MSAAIGQVLAPLAPLLIIAEVGAFVAPRVLRQGGQTDWTVGSPMRTRVRAPKL